MWYIIDVETLEVLATAETRHERMTKSLELGRGSYIIEWCEK